MILSKYSRSIGILYKVKQFLPERALLSLYYTLFLSHINYGITAWSSANSVDKNRLHVLQKRALRGCEMGPWLVLVSPCFRENIVATCKSGCFLCSLDNLPQKNVIVLFFGNQISKWRSFEKKGLFLTYFSHFLVTRKKLQKFLQHISQTHRYTYFAHPIILTFFALPILKKIRIDQVRFLFGMSPGVDSYSRHFGTVNK